MTSEYREVAPEPGMQEPDAPPRPQGIPMPLHRPIVTNVLLGIIAVVFALQLFTDWRNLQVTVVGRPYNITENILVAYGAQIDGLVALGGYWRLLTSMFLHFGLAHFVFNAWALLSLGREVEALYGTPRFTVIYFLSGLFGSMASYWLAPTDWALVPSAGASGAIFGLVGADLAFVLVNRRGMGHLGRQQLGNLIVLIAINLGIGFSPGSGINNYAHLGGLAAGLALGLGLASRYVVQWNGLAPSLADRRSKQMQLFAVAGILLLLIAGVYLGDQRWAPYRPELQQILLLPG